MYLLADQAQRTFEITGGGLERISVNRQRRAKHDQRRAVLGRAHRLLDRQAADGLDGHGDTLTFFESPRSGLSRSASDYCLIILPFLRPLFRWIYTVLVAFRSKARSVLSNWLVDSLIRFFRSESDMHYFTTVRQLGGGFK